MGVLGAAKYVQFLIHATTQGALGQHSLDGEFHGTLGMFLEQLTQRDAL